MGGHMYPGTLSFSLFAQARCQKLEFLGAILALAALAATADFSPLVINLVDFQHLPKNVSVNNPVSFFLVHSQNLQTHGSTHSPSARTTNSYFCVFNSFYV
ncbi:hypothetical protein F4818DRAFT_400968 [Hypoxylon cercidicola]|nr:hypothetical protein F4818DRAFT_400968 [Hypoxylon cercidicola]